jgi:hypothetical protein
MPEYEICVLNADRYSAVLIQEQMLANDETAIIAASRLASGAPFEVWRDLDCIYGLASARPLSRTGDVQEFVGS